MESEVKDKEEGKVTDLGAEAQAVVDSAVKAALGEILGPERKLTSGTDTVEVGKDLLIDNPTGGFKSFGDFCLAVAGRGKDSAKSYADKLSSWEQATKTAGLMEEGDMSQGGYLVPEEFRAELLQTQLETAVVRPRATEIPMSTNRIVIPAVKDNDHSSNFYGGILIRRTGEGAQKDQRNPVMGQVALTLHKLTGYCLVTDELLEDSPISLEPILSSMFGQSISFTEDDDFLNGTGTNQAVGAFSSSNPSRVSVAKESGQTANTIVYANTIKMLAQLHPSCWGRAVWLANIECLPQLATMTLAVGSGGSTVWLPAGGASGSPYNTLWGRPVIFTEKMQALGTIGDIGLADFSQYLVAQKSGGSVKMATSIHIRFDYDETAFRFVLRYDGQPWWLSSLTPKRGSNALSPFVVLATRS